MTVSSLFGVFFFVVFFQLLHHETITSADPALQLRILIVNQQINKQIQS